MSTSPTHSALEVYPPVLVVGKSEKFLRAYPDVAIAVNKVQANFIDGGYKKDYGEFDRYRLVDEYGFFDTAGRELTLVWESEDRLSTMQVRHDQEYVRGRIQAMLHQIEYELQTGDLVPPDTPLTDPDYNTWPYQGFAFEDLAQRLVDVLYDGGSLYHGWIHRAFGGH
jgi:hypothetical protein